jgi:hypothetical protein
MPLDRGTKIYAAILGGIVLIGLVAWLLTLDPRLGEIDRMLQADPEIAGYPYHFRVLEIQRTTAVVSTPRSPDMPAVQFLSIIYPNLSNKDAQSPEMIAAEKELASVQSKVRKLILSRPDIDKVRWSIDKEWYADKGMWLE